MIYWYNPYVVDYPSPGGFPIGKSNSEDWDMVTGQVRKNRRDGDRKPFWAEKSTNTNNVPSYPLVI